MLSDDEVESGILHEVAVTHVPVDAREATEAFFSTLVRRALWLSLSRIFFFFKYFYALQINTGEQHTRTRNAHADKRRFPLLFSSSLSFSSGLLEMMRTVQCFTSENTRNG